ncbi:ASCH domain-containing protein [Clostridium botulinum]|nr:ASCH domain-containing protein [Clostridium botulinum]ACD53419.1 ProFAR isomerase associated superfamily [Clostridium botulinum E3 str. Alaska E43]MBY6816497.1 ASCH domain-containing protein [Clostridium botulinum]MBY6827248.1 ASCH domain-containing protein [Clostridium botulinum]MBY6859196.1 ASCH domain-containing protein [Clostridium botulinum]MCR1158714.1 ASCH domain-containing protein [Clostridium botulinum]
MTFNMNLQEKYFNYIVNGSKDIEIRLLDEKRSKLSVGDIIIFNSHDKSIKVKVINIKLFNSFSDLLSNINGKRIGFSTSSQNVILNELYSIYSESKVCKYKVMCIEFKKI